MDYLLLILGLAVLIVGGEFLVKGAVGFSAAFKISPLVIGMTVVSFGTSAPELLVSLQSALDGNPGIAIGNVVGSNIANIALVLGITVLIFPIIAERQTKFVDYPMMLFACILFYLFALDNVIELYEGIILFGILVTFTTYLVINSRKKTKKAEAEADDDISEALKYPIWKSVVFLLIGLVALYFGSDWFVKGAVGIAEVVLEGNPDKDSIIGVTVVALGTSAPELVASIVAAIRKQSDISVGNLIGSNIFNVFAVIGITSMVTPIEVSDQVLGFDMYWMLGIVLLLIPILLIGKRIGRLKGVILFGSYVAYVTVILLRIQGVF
ncbi:MAG: calcium/sodium antiporter [Crocinitomicaceae bacterium]|nr:calcium/sodium antiporter [Flavobacteriales bacterium]NQZ37858.1 calcium/sodium antiporter [Crocinitomicaceae bacterium]